MVDVPETGIEVEIKIRSNQSPSAGRLFSLNTDQAYVVLDQPQFGISAGQACVCYVGNRVIGGGWITGAENSQKAA